MRKLVYLLFLIPVLWLCGCSTPPTSSGTGGSATVGYQKQRPHPLGHGPGPQGFRRVMIDAGHGGHDSGAISRSTGQREKDLALDTARRVQRALGSGFQVSLMRTGDNFVELDERVARANRQADVLVSIHYNAGARRMRGPEVYYWRVDSHGLAVRMQRALNRVYGGNTNSHGLVRRRLRLTRNPRIPSVLVECGYLSNSEEARRIASPRFRQQLAEAIAEAIRAQAAMGDRGTGAKPRPLNEPPSKASDRRR